MLSKVTQSLLAIISMWLTGCRCCGHGNLLGHLYGCYPKWINNCILPIHINIILFCTIVVKDQFAL